MKFIVAILVFFSILTAQGQWQNVGNSERIKAYDTEIKDFVISEDNKFIYTLDGYNIFKKWDFGTGILLDSTMIITDNSIPIFGNKVSLSNDSKTYIIASFIRASDYSYYIKILINVFDINTKIKIKEYFIDSIQYDSQAGYYYSFNFLDYHYKKDLIVCLIKKSGIGYPPYSSGSGGQLFFLIKQDSIYQKKTGLTSGYTSLVFYNNQITKIYISTIYNSSTSGHGQNPISSSTVALNYSITDLMEFVTSLLPEYYYYSNSSGYKETRGPAMISLQEYLIKIVYYYLKRIKYIYII